MQNPRTPGTGITGAKAVSSLAGDDLLLPHDGPELQRRYRLALRLDREADAALFFGQIWRAERLSHIAAELRERRQ